jgi:hypothetical protein
MLTIEIVEHSDTISRHSNQFNSIEKTEENSTPQIMKRIPAPISTVATETSSNVCASSDDDDEEDEKNRAKQQVAHGGGKRNSNTKFPYPTALPSPHGSAHSFDIQVRERFYQLFMKHKY